MFPESSDDIAPDPIGSARLYVEALCQMFPDASANLGRALAFQILIYSDQTEPERWAQGARSSFEAKVLNAYPQTAPEDYPVWPSAPPAPTERPDVPPDEGATPVINEAQDEKLNDSVADSAIELESASIEEREREREPQQRWFHHAELGELLGQIDDETALLREAAHRWSALLHDGFEESGAQQCRQNWEQSRAELDALWQQMEDFASLVPEGGRIKAPRDASLDEELERFSALFGEHPSARLLSCENCHGELQELMMDLEARTDEGRGETLESWIANWLEADVADADGVIQDLRALRAELENLGARTLEEELEELLKNYRRASNNERADAEESYERRSEMVRQRLGWNGVARRTLSNMAQEWEVSRERVRQVVGKLEIWVAETSFFTPVLDRALRLTQQQLPAPADAVALRLQSAGVTRGPWSLESLSDTARSLGRDAAFVLTPIQIEGGAALVVAWTGENGDNNKPLPQRLWHAITTHIWERGIGCWPELQREIADDEGEDALALAAAIANNHPAVRWLDQAHRWFWLDETRALRHQENRLLTPVVRALSVARRISPARLYDAVTRAHLRTMRSRYDWEMPPHEIFEAWLRGQSRFTLENGEIAMPDAPPWREVLDNTEAMMIEILEEHGPLLSRYNFYLLALERGIPKPTFYIYVDGFSTIEEVDDGVFALVGASVTPGQLAEFHADYNNVPKRFQLRYGRLDENRLWLSYRINQGKLDNGLLKLPKAMEGEFEGRYPLKDSRGAAAGTLSFSLTQCWGLKTYFAQHVSAGDRVTLIIDKASRQADIFIGLGELPHAIWSEVEGLKSGRIEDEDDV